MNKLLLKSKDKIKEVKEVKEGKSTLMKISSFDKARITPLKLPNLLKFDLINKKTACNRKIINFNLYQRINQPILAKRSNILSPLKRNLLRIEIIKGHNDRVLICDKPILCINLVIGEILYIPLKIALNLIKGGYATLSQEKCSKEAFMEAVEHFGEADIQVLSDCTGWDIEDISKAIQTGDLFEIAKGRVKVVK